MEASHKPFQEPLPPHLEALVERKPAVTMNAQGRIVLPAEIRKALDLRPGERILVEYDEKRGKIELTVPRVASQWWRDELARRFGTDGPRWSDELIAERRAEAAREAAE